MELVQTYAKEIVALLVPFITWMLNAPQRSRAKLLRGTRHAFTFLVPEPLLDAKGNQLRPNQTVNTASVVIQNAGRQTATNVELVFNWKPMCINFWPSRHMDEKIESDGRYVILLSSLSPGEFLGFELMAVNAGLPQLVTARSDQCVASEVHMAPQQVISAWKARLAVFLMFAGVGATVYVLLVVIQWVLSTPALPLAR